VKKIDKEDPTGTSRIVDRNLANRRQEPRESSTRTSRIVDRMSRNGVSMMAAINDRTFPPIGPTPPLGSIPLQITNAALTLQGLPKRPRLAGSQIQNLNALAQYFGFGAKDMEDYVGDDGLLETAPSSQNRIVVVTPMTDITLDGENVTPEYERGMPIFCFNGISSPMSLGLNRSLELENFPKLDQGMLDEFVCMVPDVLNLYLLQRACNPETPPIENTPWWIRRKFGLRGVLSTDKSENVLHYNVIHSVIDILASTATIGQYWTKKLWPNDRLEFVVKMVPTNVAIAFCLSTDNNRYEVVQSTIDRNGVPVPYVPQIFAVVTPDGVVDPKVMDTYIPGKRFRKLVRGYAWRLGRVDSCREQGGDCTRADANEVYNTTDLDCGMAVRSRRAFAENRPFDVYVGSMSGIVG